MNKNKKHELNEHGIEELIERYCEFLRRFKNELLNNGFNEDGAKLMKEVIKLVYKYAKDNRRDLTHDDKLIMEIERIGIDWWGKEAKKRMHEGGLRTKADFKRAIKIACDIGLIHDDNKPEENEKDDSYPIYNGWD